MKLIWTLFILVVTQNSQTCFAEGGGISGGDGDQIKTGIVSTFTCPDLKITLPCPSAGACTQAYIDATCKQLKNFSSIR